MDAFFASVELLHYPELRGRPVVVGGRRIDAPRRQADGSLAFARLGGYVGRGVITTSTYEARALGVFSGMGLMKAAQLAPEAVLLPASFDAYRDCSRRFKAAVASVAPCIEDRGIDEIYIDLSALPDDSLSLARRIKAAVSAATGLSCSIGIAANKLLAKIASDLDKPDGITLIAPDDLQGRIWPLPARRINGIGPKATARLTAMGVETIGDLAAVPLVRLLRDFGQNYGNWLHRSAHGLDDRPVVTERDPKSVSRETTFERDLDAVRDRPLLSEAFTGLCARVADDLARKGLVARTIGIKLRYADFSVVTRDFTLPQAVAGAAEIRRAAGQCLKRVVLDRRIRLLGVRASALAPAGAAVEVASPVQLELM